MIENKYQTLNDYHGSNFAPIYKLTDSMNTFKKLYLLNCRMFITKPVVLGYQSSQKKNQLQFCLKLKTC